MCYMPPDARTQAKLKRSHSTAPSGGVLISKESFAGKSVFPF